MSVFHPCKAPKRAPSAYCVAERWPANIYFGSVTEVIFIPHQVIEHPAVTGGHISFFQLSSLPRASQTLRRR